MKCTNCQKEIPDKANVCGYCGISKSKFPPLINVFIGILSIVIVGLIISFIILPGGIIRQDQNLDYKDSDLIKQDQLTVEEFEYSEGDTEHNTDTQEEQVATQKPTSVSDIQTRIYDSFENPRYDGFYNGNLWERSNLNAILSA